MKNHKGKPVYTFDGCLAIIENIGHYADRYEFAELHRDVFNDSEKVAKVMGLLGSESTTFLATHMKYWEKEFASSEESSEVMEQQPAAKKAKPSSAAMFKQPAKQDKDNSDERHHTRRNGHM